jgi:uncharacterized protein (DUF1330 family)
MSRHCRPPTRIVVTRFDDWDRVTSWFKDPENTHRREKAIATGLAKFTTIAVDGVIPTGASN